MSNKSGFLVRWRYALLALTAAAALISVLLIPRTRINADMTSNLPDDSPMRHGITLLEQYFPQMDIRMQTLRVMFVAEPPADSLDNALGQMLEGARKLDVRQNGSYTLYHYMLPPEMDGKAIQESIKDRFGDRVEVEVEDNSGMPDNIVMMMATGVITGLLILFLMCHSLIEPLLILLTLIFAIMINMGTNALLPSVRLITHTLAAVLQLVLSMDYAIILLNRYKQQRKDLEKEQAMVAAIRSAAPAILSSGLTTIVSLLMLIFMRLKIGADLGIVLSKGVLCSLIATFTVLPSLILFCDKAIMKGRKHVPQIPTDGLALFELRFRLPLAILFIGLFAGSWFLQRQTEISYAIVWPTPITKVFPPDNTLLMLYRTDDEQAMISLTDTIASLEKGVTCINYPSIALKPMSTEELAALSPELASQVPPEALDLLYYAASHPEREERMRIDELEPTAKSLLDMAGQFLPEEAMKGIASRFDMKRLMRQLSYVPPMSSLIPSAPEAGAADDEVPQAEIPDQAVDQEMEDSVETVETEQPDAAEAPVLQQTDTTAKSFTITYEDIMKQRTAAEMAAFFHFDKQQISMVYRLAGAGRRGRPATMNMDEFFTAINDKVLGNKLYSVMVPTESAAQFREMRKEIDKIIQAGPTKPATPEEPANPTPDKPEKPAEGPAPHTGTPDKPAHDTTSVKPVPEEHPVTVPTVEEEPEVLSPLEQLADMAFSGKRYSAAQCYSALTAAGVSVKREELDLLFLYHGYKNARDTSTRLSLMQVADYVNRLAENPLIRQYADSTQLAGLSGIRERLEGELGALRSDPWSLAVITSGLPVESDRTFDFIDHIQERCKASLGGETYLVGHSQMYKEIKEGFPRELLVLTLLTIAALFLIVALTFRSLIIPLLLIPTVLMAVWLNVFVSGLGGNHMLFLAYLIVQSILMGATIDYSILFTHYYCDARKTMDRGASLATAYRGAIHAILTSGMILVAAPWLMTLVISGEMIISILRSISAGALAAILLILFVLPGALALMDKRITK